MGDKSVLHPRRTGRFLAGLAVYFALQSLFVEYLIERVLDPGASSTLVHFLDLFSVNAELTIPTWYATLLLFVAAVLFGWIAAAKRLSGDRFTGYWIGLSLIFCYLSMDEGAVIHEIVADWIQVAYTPTGFLAFGWQIVAIPLILVTVLVYLRFLKHLPPKVRTRFILSALLYVGGAIVVEGVSANQYSLDGGVTFEYLAIATVEELFEMLGVVLLIHTLLEYIIETQSVTLAVQHANPVPGSAIMTAENQRKTFPSARVFMLVGLIVVAMNAVFVFWALEPPPEPGQSGAALSTPADWLMHQVAIEGVVVSRMEGAFGMNPNPAHQVVQTLSDAFEQVTVIALVAEDTSIVLASSVLPYDRQQLTGLLHATGIFEFIIFEPPAVQALLRTMRDPVRQTETVDNS
jgi:hypothetical protein